MDGRKRERGQGQKQFWDQSENKTELPLRRLAGTGDTQAANTRAPEPVSWDRVGQLRILVLFAATFSCLLGEVAFFFDFPPFLHHGGIAREPLRYIVA